LINEQTASAAELCAGVLRDHGRAVPLGTRTFGKGSVQQLVKLDDGGALRVTTSYYYLPSGRMIDKRAGDKGWGIDPDDGFYVPLTKVQSDALQKNQMDRFTLGSGKAGEGKMPARLTPKMIEEQYADPQLAAAMRSLVAKLTGGEFLKVGQSTANVQDQMRRLEELRQRREALLQDLKRLEKDIDAAAGKK
jgi:carboxyl-terminal processing protease